MDLDRKLTNHYLLQAIARVNRTKVNKFSGYIVDYFGLTDYLADALKVFSSTDIKGVLKDEIPKLQSAPAPLPILGLPAVLFYSRKLKKRIKASRELSSNALVLLGLCRNWVSLPHMTPKKPLKRWQSIPPAIRVGTSSKCWSSIRQRSWQVEWRSEGGFGEVGEGLVAWVVGMGVAL